MNTWPIKLIAGEVPPYDGEQLYLTNANNGVAYLYREEKNGYFEDDSDYDMIKIGWIPASANPPLNQRETPLLAHYTIVPITETVKTATSTGIMQTGKVNKEFYVTDIKAETKEERAKRLHSPKGISNTVETNESVLYRGKVYPNISYLSLPEQQEVKKSYFMTNSDKALRLNVGSITLKPQKEETMISQILQVNKNAAEQAAQLELGRVANATLENILAKKFPNLPATPFNALVIANLAFVIGKQVKPSPKLEKLTNAMVTSAYGEVFQLLDLEGMIKELLDAVGDKLVD